MHITYVHICYGSFQYSFDIMSNTSHMCTYVMSHSNTLLTSCPTHLMCVFPFNTSCQHTSFKHHCLHSSIQPLLVPAHPLSQHHRPYSCSRIHPPTPTHSYPTTIPASLASPLAPSHPLYTTHPPTHAPGLGLWRWASHIRTRQEVLGRDTVAGLIEVNGHKLVRPVSGFVRAHEPQAQVGALMQTMSPPCLSSSFSSTTIW
jgi:hypothetical protein